MRVDIQVKPGSRKGPLVQPSLDGRLLVYVREPAKEGKANEAVISQLAEYYGVAKSKVGIVGGRKSKLKTVRIDK